MNEPASMNGRCTCGSVRYRLLSEPMFVHCCHCSWCQRETGTAFALNALIESNRVELLQGEPEFQALPSASGKGQRVARCPECHVALWSHYAGAGDAVAFVRVGTLEQPGLCPPDVHIYVSSRLPWLALPDETPAFEGYYSPKQLWPQASQARYLEARQT